MIFIIDHIHHLMNESKIQNFAYNSDRRVYTPSTRASIYTNILHPSLIIGPFGKITGIKKIENDNKFVCNYYCFYNFIL